MSAERLRRQLERIAADLCDGTAVRFTLERPRVADHGDLATNVAMVLAGSLRRSPREVAAQVIERLDRAEAGLVAADIAGPGFINFRFGQGVIGAQLAAVLEADRAYGRGTRINRERIQVEFVSANPTGPLHVAHGRGAALGDAIAALLQWSGHDVQREFYVNDAGVQMNKLAESVHARWLELNGTPAEVPEGGYHGGYIRDLAADLERESGDAMRAMDEAERIRWMRSVAVERLRNEQDETLRLFRVHFDNYFSETQLYERNETEQVLAELRERGLVFDEEGAVWLRTSAFGDDKDRVLVKSDGSYTYFLPDIAYHWDKLRRGFDHGIDVWGADHHGYVPRMKAALAALGRPEFLDVEVVQMVRLTRGGEEVKFSKRAGDFISLRELVEEVGVDVARYFFLMRRGDTQMLFDLDLALDQSEKNPVYKVQYAHARMMSIFRKAGVEAADAGNGADLDALDDELEQQLIKQLAQFPELVQRAAEARAPHVVCDFLETTAAMVNSWYHAGNPSRNPELAVLTEDPRLRGARLALARGVRIVLRNGLELLGLGAPERMLREEMA